MKKLVVLSIIAPAILGLSACGGSTTTNTTTTENTVSTVDDGNLTVDENATGLDSNLSDNATTANAL
jgi:hypothetical protein